MRRHLARVLLVVLTAAFGLGVFAPVSAPAGCVGPTLRVSGARPSGEPVTNSLGVHAVPVGVLAGEELSVRGRWFFTDCNDTSGSTGCSKPEPAGATGPQRDVPLRLEQGRREWLLGVADASGPGRQFSVRWDVTVPADVAPGLAMLSTPSSQLPIVVGATKAGAEE